MTAPDPYEQPADLTAVAHDDELLDRIGSGARLDPDQVDPADRALVVVFQGWRTEIDREPARELIDTATAVEVVRAGGGRHRKGHQPRANRRWWRQFLRRWWAR